MQYALQAEFMYSSFNSKAKPCNALRRRYKWSCLEKFFADFNAIWQQGDMVCPLSTAKWSIVTCTAGGVFNLLLSSTGDGGFALYECSPNFDAQICPHTGQATAAVGFTLLFFLAWRLASCCSSRCSSKNLTPDAVHCLQAVRFAARASQPVTEMLQARMNWWGSLCIVWLDVPRKACY